MKILFICTGNMHRSPLAAAMLRAELARDLRADIEVASAGTIRSPGLPVVDEAAQLAADAGLDVSSHRSMQATASMVNASDRILVMERYHLEWIQENHPDAAARCRLLSEYAGPECGIAPGDDVPDAVGEEKDSFLRTFSILSECVQRFYRELPAPPEDVYTQAIEERFRLRRRTPLTLSPADFEMAGRWWQQGIPLWIVIESIDDLFRKKEGSGDPSRIRRLSWCARAIEARFAEYQRSQVSPTGTGRQPASDASEALFLIAAQRLHLAADAARVRGLSNIVSVLSKAADEILAVDKSAVIEPAAARLILHRVEERILAELRLATDEIELRGIREAAASSLSAHRARMTSTAFEATLERLVSQRLRELYDLPRLSSD